MDLQFSNEELRFQQEVRDWIADTYPKEMRERKELTGGTLTKEDYVFWQKALYEKGWAGINWPEEFGGPGFLRLNFGCPPAFLQEGLKRFHDAFGADKTFGREHR